MKAKKEKDLKRIFGEVMFNEFLAYMKGKTYVNSTTELMYYTTNIDNFLLSFFHRTFLEILYSRELEKAEIEV
jgi:hypothetical protein